MISKDKRILIIGLGLIGGSYAMKLSNLGYKVYAIDIDKNVLEYAINNSIIINDKLSDEELIRKADIIILGLYPLTGLEWIIKNKNYLNKDCIISDVSGVKNNYVEIIQNELANNEFISMHPMAGKEKMGVYYSDPSIFLDANMLIIKTDKNTKRGIEFAYDLANLLEFKNIEVLSPKEHDEIVSFLSQLPHAIAVSLMNSHNNDSLSKYSGDSFRDLTRIAKINEDLWSELFLLNKDTLINDIDSFINALEDLKDKIKEEDKEGLKELFIESTKRRKAFEK